VELIKVLYRKLRDNQLTRFNLKLFIILASL